jgi:hypothetical protein
VFRYFLYMVMTNMLVNVIVFVPRLLIQERFEGAVMAMLIGIPISAILLYFYSNAIFKFPGQGLPEILNEHTPPWFSKSFVMITSTFWFYAGWFLLLAFADVSRRFVNPDMTETTLVSLFLIVVGMGVLLKTEKVLYALEIVLIFCIPLITLIFIKSYTNPYLEWDAMKVVMTHYQELPSMSSLGAIAYTLYGFYNIAIFNRAFKGQIKKVKKRWVVLIIIAGYINAFTSMFIPIGFNGTIGVEQYVFPWVSTADSMRMELAFVERVVFVMLFLYIVASLMMVIVTWHVGLQFLHSLIPTQKLKQRTKKWIPLGIFVVYAAITFATEGFIETTQLLELTKLYYVSLIPIGVFSTLLVTYLARRKQSEL